MAAVFEQCDPVAWPGKTAAPESTPRVAMDGPTSEDLLVAIRRWGRLSGLTGFNHQNPHAIEPQRLMR